MKKLLFSVFIALYLFSCKQSISRKKTTNESDEVTVKKIVQFRPNKIDITMELDSILDRIKLERLYSTADSSLLDSITNINLLNVYLFHLRKANQGYNLRYMARGNAEILINYFIYRNGLLNQELVNSGAVYELIRNHKIVGAYEQKIVDSISFEILRIEKTNKELGIITNQE